MRIELELNQLLAMVSKPKRLYKTNVVSQITMKAKHGENSITKRYTRKNDQESFLRPKVIAIENILNDQLSDIAMTILTDKDLRELIINKGESQTNFFVSQR